jgi:uncharacterized membrane protein YbhN (UPF0104 family)
MSESAPTATPTAPGQGLARRVGLATLIGALVFGALLLFADARDIATELGRYSPGRFAGALALVCGNYAIRFWRWEYYLARIGVKVPRVESLLTFLSGFVMSVTPGKLGEVWKSLLLYERRQVPIERTAPIVIAERLTDLIALVLLAAVGASAFPSGWLVTAVGAGAVAFIVVVCTVRPVGEGLLGVAARVPWLAKFTPRLRAAYDSLALMAAPGPLAVASLLALVGWSLEVAAMAVILQGFGDFDVPLRGIVFAYAASQVAGALLLSPGGLGVTEAGMTGFLLAVGGPAVTRSVATATTMLVRLATLWWAVLLGVLALGAYRWFVRRHPVQPTP